MAFSPSRPSTCQTVLPLVPVNPPSPADQARSEQPADRLLGGREGVAVEHAILLPRAGPTPRRGVRLPVIIPLPRGGAAGIIGDDVPPAPPGPGFVPGARRAGGGAA